MNDPLYNSEAWGPLRGKGGQYDKSEEQVGYGLRGGGGGWRVAGLCFT